MTDKEFVMQVFGSDVENYLSSGFSYSLSSVDDYILIDGPFVAERPGRGARGNYWSDNDFKRAAEFIRKYPNFYYHNLEDSKLFCGEHFLFSNKPTQLPKLEIEGQWDNRDSEVRTTEQNGVLTVEYYG